MSGPSGLQNPLNNIDSLPDLVYAILDAVVKIGGIVLVLALVYVGFLFVAAQGNEEKIRSARSALMWTVVGGLILLGATAISTVITATVSGL
ncbi:MAG TPA: pilin [Candidatus Paceibacterota bacterium]|nr:pilin [Candidatus Paceibacterota bacterium]